MNLPLNDERTEYAFQNTSGETGSHSPTSSPYEDLPIYLDLNAEYAHVTEVIASEYARFLDTDVIGRLLDGDKVRELEKWKEFSRQLDYMRRVLDATVKPATKPLHDALDRLVAETRLVCREKLKNEEEHPGDPEPVSEVIQRLMRLMETKEDMETLSEISCDDSNEGGFPDRWIREGLQDRWTEKYAMSDERAILRARESLAQRDQDGVGLQKTLADKRELQRRVFHECIHEQLYELQRQLDRAVEEAVEELEDTLLLYTHQLSILLEGVVTAADAILGAIDLRARVVEKLIPSLEQVEREADKLQAALDTMDHSSRKMLTRIHRLCASDVQDGADREWEKQRRLASPQAVLYILKATEDAKEVWASAKDARQSSAVIDQDLASVAGRAVAECRSLTMQTHLAHMITGRSDAATR